MSSNMGLVVPVEGGTGVTGVAGAGAGMTGTAGEGDVRVGPGGEGAVLDDFFLFLLLLPIMTG